MQTQGWLLGPKLSSVPAARQSATRAGRRRKSAEKGSSIPGIAPTATFLVATTPITAHTLNATLIVQGLIAAGHRVLWYAADRFAGHIARVGAVPVPFTQARQYAGLAGYVARGMTDGLGVVRRLYSEVLVGQAADQLHDLGECLRRERVDALITDTLMMAGGLVAGRYGIPWATVGDGPLLWRDPDTPPFGSGLPPRPDGSGRRRNQVVQRVVDRWLFGPALAPYNELRVDLGLDPVDDLQSASLSPRLHLQGCSPGFEYPRTPMPAHIRFVGALGPGPGYAPPPPPQVRRTRRSRPLAFVTQGTLRHDMRELALPAVRSLTGSGFDVLVSSRRGYRSCLEDVATKGSLTVVDLVDYPAALAEADLFVTNGGYTGVTLALAAGVPVLQAGATEEKPDIGARLEWAGVGRSIRRIRPSWRLLRRTVEELMTSPERVTASQRLAREMAHYDARTLGAELLSDMVGASTPQLGGVGYDQDAGQLRPRRSTSWPRAYRAT